MRMIFGIIPTEGDEANQLLECIFTHPGDAVKFKTRAGIVGTVVPLILDPDPDTARRWAPVTATRSAR